jgi:glycosyltransferase involved in cell wall biosynthesis
MQTQTTQKPPVILQVLPALRSGGVERGTIEVARAIVQAGGVALVASSGGPMTAQLAHAGATHVTLPLKTRNPFAILRNSYRLSRLIRKYKVDIVHARSRAPAWSAWLAARRTGTHFMTTFHGTYGLQNKWKQRYNSIMTRGERVIAISYFIAQHIRAHYAVDTSRVRIIHRGVDLKLFDPFKHSPQRMIVLAKEWRLPDDLPVIIFPGRITRWKGQDVFIRALAALPHRHFFAVIVGDDNGHETYRKELEALIMACGLGDYVRIAGHTQYISEAYMLARLVVSTSIEPEAFGRVVLEAQAMGKPVVATNHGGPQETVIADVTGWLVSPGDILQLSSVIGHALALDDEALNAMAQEAIANAQHFSMDKMCDQTLSLYAELLELPAPASGRASS